MGTLGCGGRAPQRQHCLRMVLVRSRFKLKEFHSLFLFKILWLLESQVIVLYNGTGK